MEIHRWRKQHLLHYFFVDNDDNNNNYDAPVEIVQGIVLYKLEGI